MTSVTSFAPNFSNAWREKAGTFYYALMANESKNGKNEPKIDFLRNPFLLLTTAISGGSDFSMSVNSLSRMFTKRHSQDSKHIHNPPRSFFLIHFYHLVLILIFFVEVHNRPVWTWLTAPLRNVNMGQKSVNNNSGSRQRRQRDDGWSREMRQPLKEIFW